MPETKRPLKVFLCHAHNDAATVRALYSRLKREGVDVWLDKEKLLPGANWELEIRKAVQEADVVVVCLSKQFNQAGFRQKEVRIALDTAMEKLEGDIFIIPARLEECDVPDNLSRWHWVDLFEVGGHHRLIRALHARADRIGATLRIRRGGQPTTSYPKSTEQTNELSFSGMVGIGGGVIDAGGHQAPAQEKTERDAAEKAVREKARRDVEETTGKEKEGRGRSYQNRILEAAIENQVSVGVPTSLFVWIKRLESGSIISVVGSIDEDVVLDEDNVKSKGLEIEFPIEDGRVLSVGISLRLVSHDFTPPIQLKQIYVPSEGDSEVCTFIITPNRAGKLLLNLEVLKDHISIATRSIHTIAIEAEIKEHRSMALVSIPIIVFVHGAAGTSETISTEVFEPETILIPEGTFWMGSDPGEGVAAYETPRHEVFLPVYRIGKYPVTNEQYEKFVLDTGRSVAPEMRWLGLKPAVGTEMYPVVAINWYDAVAYCEWLSKTTGRKYTLPNEAQWEKACRGRGASQGFYPWGDEFQEGRCNQGNRQIAAVDAFPAQNDYGCFDLVGNVRQWTASLWGESPRFPDARFAYPWKNDHRNDLSANGHIRRVVRGSSFKDDLKNLRCSLRSGQFPEGLVYATCGFRVVMIV